MKKLLFISILISSILTSCSETHKLSIWKRAKVDIYPVTYIKIREINNFDQSTKVLADFMRSKFSSAVNFEIIPENKVENRIPGTYGAKVLQIQPEQIGIFEIESNYKESRIRKGKSKLVTLKRCDNLKKKNKCLTKGKETLVNSNQIVNAKQTITIRFVRGDDKELDRFSFEKNKKFEGLHVPDELMIQSKFAIEVAKSLFELYSPHRKEIEVEYMGGDDYAIQLLQFGAYDKALQRLSKMLVEDPSADHLYHIGLAWESLGDLNAASSYYKQAIAKDDDAIIQSALKRVQRQS